MVITKPQISNIDVKYVQILSGSEKLILALVYRPPAQNSYVDNELYEQISDICNHNDAIIFGDFNFPVTVWGGTLNSHSGHELYSADAVGFGLRWSARLSCLLTGRSCSFNLGSSSLDLVEGGEAFTVFLLLCLPSGCGHPLGSLVSFVTIVRQRRFPLEVVSFAM